VEYQGIKSNPVSVRVVEAAPGIFSADASGKGQAALLNQDATVNSASNPASPGSIVSFWATGEGQTEPAGVDGQMATGTLPKPKLPVTVEVGGVPAEVIYAGAAPGMVAGMLQVNFRVPAGLSGGSTVPLLLKVGTVRSQPGLTMAVAPSPVLPVLAGLTVSPVSATGGTTLRGQVQLSLAAPPGGVVVSLRSNSAVAQVPASVTIPGGQIAFEFSITTSPVSSVQVVNITATYNGISRIVAITLNPAATGVCPAGSLMIEGRFAAGSLQVPLGITVFVIPGLYSAAVVQGEDRQAGVFVALGVDGGRCINNELTFSHLVQPGVYANGTIQETIISTTFSISVSQSAVRGTATGKLKFSTLNRTVDGSFTGTVVFVY
jgi:hypothetical protein